MVLTLIWLTLFNINITVETGYSYAPINHSDNSSFTMNHGVDLYAGLSVPITPRLSIQPGYHYSYFIPGEGRYDEKSFRYSATLSSLSLLTLRRITPWITVGCGWGLYELDWYDKDRELLDEDHFNMSRYHFGLKVLIKVTNKNYPFYATLSGTLLSLDYNDRVLISSGIGYTFYPGDLF